MNEFTVPQLLTPEIYQKLYQLSIQKPMEFWLEQAKRLEWASFPTKTRDGEFDHDIHIRWFEDGTLNASYNCIDRHLPARAKDTAIIWVGDEPGHTKYITFQELHDETLRMSGALRNLGVKRGDVVTIYLPMIPEAAYAMLACARLGAIHSVVFGGFSANALTARVQDGQSKIIITSDISKRGGKTVPLKHNVDECLGAALDSPDYVSVDHVLVVKRGDGTVPMHEGRDIWWDDVRPKDVPDIAPEIMQAEDPLFILYTSGSTGKPKGVVHTTGGYMVYSSLTHQVVFDAKPGDIYWCTADVGWITGHSYVVYAPLANGVTTVMFEGVPSYPDASRCWQVIDELGVTQFYTAPTAIRALMREGDKFLNSTKRDTLRILGSVGEPINPSAWDWFHDLVGHGKCPIVDTYWQTETGAHMITPLKGATHQKPGSATLPFFGIEPVLVDQKGTEITGAGEGLLCMRNPWPSMARTILHDHHRFTQTYFHAFPGFYFTGDGARRDEDGDYWITGRVDDVINVSGHRIGTAEVEFALNMHDAVSESAVVAMPHEIKGQGIFAYILVRDGIITNKEFPAALRAIVQERIGALAKPDEILVVPGLPKTRSGKIMRRILRKIAEREYGSLGDISTLAEPGIVDSIIALRK